MFEVLKRFGRNESGAEILEWIVVTLILILAIYALLQAFGPEIEKLLITLVARFR